MRSSKARLTIIAEFDDVPSDRDLTELLDSIRNVGGIENAKLEILGPVTRDLVSEGL